MNSTAEALSATQVRLTVEVPCEEFDPALAAALQEPALAGNVGGFRKARIPFGAADARVGGTVLPAVVQDAVLAGTAAAASEHGVRMLGRPEVEIASTGIDGPLGFSAVVDRRPDIELPDLSSIVVSVDPIGAPETEIDAYRHEVRDQTRTVRDAALDQIFAATTIAIPEGVVADEVAARKQWMVAELRRVGTCLADHLEAEDLTEADLDQRLFKATTDRVRAKLFLDAFADAEGIEVDSAEIDQELVGQAEAAGLTPEALRDQFALAGALTAVRDDIRRAKAVTLVLRRITCIDTGGNRLALDERLR